MIRVVQWNTHHGGVGSDGKLNTERLAHALALLMPDIVSLNEVEQFNPGRGNANQVGLIASILPGAWSYHVVSRGGVPSPASGQVNVIFARDGIAAKSAKGLVFDRSAAYASIGGKSVYSVHIDNASANNRCVQLAQLLCWHKEHADPFISCGDYNCQIPTAVELAPWRHWYKDAWTEAQRLGTATAFNHSGVTKTSRIDAIFFRGLQLISCEVPDTRVDGVFPSDHHPVVAVFE
jgi:endonuclease/exonuclease/phosphatase family metal-dependent hydrolase